MGGGNDEEDEEKEANKEALALSHTRVLRCPDSSTKSRSIDVSFPPSLRSRQSFWFVGFLSLPLSLALRASVTLRGEQLLHRGGVRLGPVVVVAATAHGRCHRTAYLLSHSHRSLGDEGERTRGETVTVGCDATCKSGRA